MGNGKSNNETVYTDEFVSMLSACAGTTKVHAQEMLTAFFNTVEYYMHDGKEINLKGFGKFFQKDMRSRVGRNPHTGDAVPIDARKVVAFSPGKDLRDSILDN